MGQMINRGQEIIRINPSQPNEIQYSTNGGSNWYTRFSGNSVGNFQDLIENGNEILAQTSQGLYYSTNEGANWYQRS